MSFCTKGAETFNKSLSKSSLTVLQVYLCNCMMHCFKTKVIVLHTVYYLNETKHNCINTGQCFSHSGIRCKFSVTLHGAEE